MALSPPGKGKALRWRAVAAVAVALTVGGAVLWFLTREDSGLRRIPLGVEQAAIVTYSGPELTVAPYKAGVAVNLRIAGITVEPDRRIYDLRYLVNREGTFDLKDYLAATDGSALTDLPTFQFMGDPILSKSLDTRIEETEEVRVEVGGRYYETMGGLVVLWLAWLMLLIFYKRPHPLTDPEAALPEPTSTERLRGFLHQLEAGTLTTTEKARLEMVMLHRWRDELAVGDQAMAVALARISGEDRTSEPLQKLQHWLHHPISPVTDAEIAAILRPYTLDERP